MKKIYLAAMAVAALTVSSCSQDEVLNMNPEAGAKAIEFGVYTGKAAQTRGTEVTTTTIEANGFGVTAVHHTDAYNNEVPNFMYNQKVDKTTESWAYSPIKYWPTTQGSKLTFFAYAPYNGTGITSTGNDASPKTLTFELQTDPKNTVDFVAAAMYDEVSSATPATVSFKLKHELTRLAFKAVADDDLYSSAGTANKTKIVITDVKFEKVDGKFYTKATYTYSATDNSHGTWEGVTGFDKSYSINNLVNMSEIKLGTKTESQYIKTGIAIEGKTAVDLFNATDATTKHYLFLIPTEENGLAADGDVKITFSYDIVTEDEALTSGYSITSAVKTVNLKKDALKQGQAYSYTFTFGVDKVVFDAEVDPAWTSSDVADDVDYDDQK